MIIQKDADLVSGSPNSGISFWLLQQRPAMDKSGLSNESPLLCVGILRKASIYFFLMISRTGILTKYRSFIPS